MVIKTNFKEGDEVWTMTENKPKLGKILKPYFKDSYGEHKDLTLEERLQWELDIKEFSPYASFFQINIKRSENELLKNKEELIKSL